MMARKWLGKKPSQTPSNSNNTVHQFFANSGCAKNTLTKPKRTESNWRSRADSNCCTSFCRALPSHSATGPCCVFNYLDEIIEALFYCSAKIRDFLFKKCEIRLLKKVEVNNKTKTQQQNENHISKIPGYRQ